MHIKHAVGPGYEASALDTGVQVTRNQYWSAGSMRTSVCTYWSAGSMRTSVCTYWSAGSMCLYILKCRFSEN